MTQTKVGWRAYVAPSSGGTQSAVSTLLTSLYGAWNGDTLGTTLDSGIFGAWNADGNSNDSVSTNNGTVMGGMTYTTGKIGQAFTFDGVNDYVALPNNSLNFTGNFSFSLWMNRKAAVQANILSNFYNGATPYGWWLSITNGTLLFRMGNGNSIYICDISTTLLGANVWQLITITKNSSSVKMYIDGVLKTSASLTVNVVYTTTHYPMIGAAKYDSGSPVGFLESGCLIDGVTTWQKELTSDEVTQLYNLGNGTQYPFSTQTLPSSGNQLGVDNATLMNGTTFTDGKIGKAFTFDGINDSVRFPAGSMNFTGDFSISGWVNLSSVYNGTYEATLIVNVTAPSWFTNPKGFWVSIAGNSVIFDLWNGTTGVRCSWDDSTGSIVKANSGWIHIVATRKSSTGSKLYVNGVLKASNTSTINPTYDPTYQTPNMGSRYILNSSGSVVNSSVFAPAGTKIDGLSVWQKELTSVEITELYNSGNGKQLTPTPIVTNGLVLNLDTSRTSSYPGTGTTWTDISGSGNNGTMLNAVGYSSLDGGSLTFDQINDYISLPNMSTYLMKKSKFTYETWIKVNNPGMANTYLQTLFSFGNNGEYSNDIMFFIQSNYLNIQINNGADGGCVIPYASTSWNNVCIVYDGTQVVNSNRIKIYINGILQTITTTYTIPSTTANINVTNCGIGAYSCNNFANCHFGGNIGSARLYTTSLTSTEVTQNFNVTKSRFGL
jgi:hypothetical protein